MPASPSFTLPQLASHLDDCDFDLGVVAFHWCGRPVGAALARALTAGEQVLHRLCVIAETFRGAARARAEGAPARRSPARILIRPHRQVVDGVHEVVALYEERPKRSRV